MSEDKQGDLVTLVWLGRGDGAVDEWGELRAEAGRAYNRRTPSYLLGMRLSRSSAFRAKSLKRTTCANRPGTNPTRQARTIFLARYSGPTHGPAGFIERRASVRQHPVARRILQIPQGPASLHSSCRSCEFAI
jgi:hypothetical protein